ncbi:hypothetical protein [Ensifer soli]|uniref:hypothetical protein n=1 Tax=Ciceribacter sp. sgz301302 TaxID=3342379 RepID=UPI0035B7335E
MTMPERPADDDIRLCLARMLAASAFGRSERLRNFLKYVVEKEIAGEAHQLKGYTIAIDVFGRSQSFNADSDPLVRVHAGKLRKCMDLYYAEDGADDPWRIVIPKGTYVPEYHLNAPAAPAEAEPQAATTDEAAVATLAFAGAGPDTAPPPVETGLRRRVRRILPARLSSSSIAMLSSLLPLLLIVPLSLPFGSADLRNGDGAAARESASARIAGNLPGIFVIADGKPGNLASTFAAALTSAARSYRTVTLRADGEPATAATLDFVVKVKPEFDPVGLTISVVHQQTNAVASQTFIGSDQLNDADDMMFESVSLAARLLPMSGPIYDFSTAAGLSTPLMTCMLATDRYRAQQTRENFRAAEECQRDLLADDAEVGFVSTAGSLLYVFGTAHETSAERH